MRRLLTILLMVALLSPIASATITNSVSGRPTADWFGESTGTGKNVGILFLREVETAINAGYSFSSDNLWVADSQNMGWGNVVGTPDVNMAWDGTNFLTTSVTADTPWVIGTITTGFDITYTFEGAGTFRTDYDGDFINLTDDMDLRFGTGASTNGDFQISSSSANLLTIGQIAAGTGTVAVGVDDAGLDFKFFGDTASEYLLWDTDADTLIGNLGNVSLTTVDAEANQILLDATGTVAGDAITVSTSDGAIAITAVGGVNGDVTITTADDLTFNSSGVTTFSDKALTNIGDISCDDIISDADSDIYLSAYKTVIKTVDVNADGTGDDFYLDNTAANQVEQPINIGAVIPAYASIVSVELRCFETVTGSAAMSIDIGTATGGAEVIAAANVDTANDISATEAGGGPEIVATNAARSIWVNFTPDANFNGLSEGRWAIMVTYVDFGAVYTQKNP